ncbi:hypothetical protein BJ085DRAFT_31461 [Dimargaris cristalligena]|uniref:Uncharacterized protein n=1 Tax=Dimargaris cristalligena TaxID=215637 RepID=A0A4P9ZUD8_9FUNG|nr:hypothetical protein BJ085DRAFT_31461 [Dimargaris cristalligena]|eukprot:RKP36858.1 hypothetical protein BJ085DRAFT_31461 [Dimargaris cristalligena]
MASGSLTQSQLKFNFPKPRRPLKPLDFKNALQSTSASAPSPQDSPIETPLTAPKPSALVKRLAGGLTNTWSSSIPSSRRLFAQDATGLTDLLQSLSEHSDILGPVCPAIDTWPASGFLPSITEKVNYVHSRWVCQFCSRKYRARAELGRHMPRCPRLPPFDLSKAADLQAIVPVDRDSGPMSEPNWAHGHIPPANMFTNSAANHLTAGPHLQPRPSYQPAPGAHMQPYSDALSHSHRKRPLARRGSSPQTPALALLSGLGSDSGEVHPDLLYSEDSTMLDSLMQGTIDHNPHLLYPSLGVSSDGLLNIHAMMDHPPPALSHLGTLPGSLPPSHWSTTGAGAGATPDTHILSSQFMLPPDQSDQLLHSALDNLDASEADFLLGNILSEADLDFYQRTLGPELGSDTGGRTPSASQTTTGYPPASVAPLAPTGASFESLEVDHHPIRLGLDLDDNQSTYPVDLPPSTSTARRGSTASSVAATPTLPARANLLPPTAVAASKTKAKKSASVASSRPKALPRTTVKPKTNPRGTPSPLMTVRPIATTPTTPSTTPAVDGHQVARTTTPGPTGLSNDFTQPLMYPPTTTTTANTLPNPLNFNAYNLALQNASFFNYFDPAGNYGPSAGMSFPGSAYAAPHGGNLNGTAPNGGAQMDLAMLQAFYNSTVPTSTSATAGYPTGSMATGMGPADANHLAMALSFPNNMGTGIVAASSSSANDQYNQYQYHHHQHQHSTLPNMPSVSTAAFASNNSAAFSTSTSSATAAMSYFSGYPGTVTSVGSNGLPFGTLTTMGAGSHPNPMNQSGMEGGIPSNGPDLDGLLDINAFIQ